MAEPRHLSKAPIVEAVIDIQVIAKAELPRLKELGAVLGYDAKCEDIYHTDIRFDAKLAAKTVTTSQQIQIRGYKFTAPDRAHIFQVRTNGMTISRLPPYDSWASLFTEAQRVWMAYIGVSKIEAVTRIAVRNINRLTFTLADFQAAPQKFLTSMPSVPQELDGAVAVGQWMSRFHVSEKATGMNAFLTQVSDAKFSEGKFSMVLDVDAYHAGSLSTQMSALAPLLEQLHQFKNKLFFASITDETLKEYI